MKLALLVQAATLLWLVGRSDLDAGARVYVNLALVGSAVVALCQPSLRELVAEQARKAGTP